MDTDIIQDCMPLNANAKLATNAQQHLLYASNTTKRGKYLLKKLTQHIQKSGMRFVKLEQIAKQQYNYLFFISSIFTNSL